MNVADSYFTAKTALLNHVGLTLDWVECPITDERDMYWKIEGNFMWYSPDKTFKNEDTLYGDDIYTQRFYPKHIYRGKEFTLIFCEPHVDGCKWWRIFRTDMEVKS